MKMKMKAYCEKKILRKLSGPLIFLSAFLLMSGGCSTTECFDNQNSLPLAGFYSSQKVPIPITLDSLSILGVNCPGDSILQDSVRTLSQVYLPFRIDQPSTSYEIRYLGGTAGLYRITDEITFDYEIIPMFTSVACGAVYYYKITNIDYTTNFIDSVTCPGGVITNANIENIRIYFRVNPEDEIPE